MRQYDTGATRDTDQGKNDYRGFVSPSALRRFGDYMHHHRVQADGSLRDAGNWKKGIPMDDYVSSGWRHWVDLVEAYENGTVDEEAACAVWFNVQGLLHEALKAKVLVTPARNEGTPYETFGVLWVPCNGPCDEGH